MKANKLSLAVFAVAGLFLCSSCATLFSSSTVSVQMESEPPGAQYQIGPFSGKTPDSIAIPKKSIPDFATFDLPGYERRTVPIESGITGVFWVNVLFWPGMIVDIVTGDYKTMDVPEVRASLTPLPGTTSAQMSPSVTNSATTSVVPAAAGGTPPSSHAGAMASDASAASSGTSPSGAVSSPATGK